MAVGTLLSRLTGFGRVFALAYALGFTRLTDSYNLANTAPNILYELVLGGVLPATPHVAHSVRVAAVRHDHRALLLLGLGTTAGYLLQAALQVPALRAAGVRFRSVWAPGHETVRTVLRLSGWTAGVVVGNQL